ncbi:Uncharacterized protein Fot_16061 [Forsythia ovata]|uniref:Uncharacterized protein n=1 Tax=Forsythia ovata TaxID=205694 RepID=A0ABD1WDL5_9LAMI
MHVQKIYPNHTLSITQSQPTHKGKSHKEILGREFAIINETMARKKPFKKGPTKKLQRETTKEQPLFHVGVPSEDREVTKKKKGYGDDLKRVGFDISLLPN